MNLFGVTCTEWLVLKTLKNVVCSFQYSTRVNLTKLFCHFLEGMKTSYLCIFAYRQADVHTQILHMHISVINPLQQSLICIWLLSCIFLSLYWLVARLRKPYSRRRQQCSAPTCAACLCYFRPPPGFRMQSKARRKKAEDPDFYSTSSALWLVSSMTPEKTPPEVSKTVPSLKITTWRWTPGHCLNRDSKGLLCLIIFDTKGHWFYRILGIVMVLTVQLTQHLFGYLQ